MRLLLIHGMGRTPLSLALLGRRISWQRHIVRYFGYAAFQESFDQIVGRLVATIRATADQHPYALIGHSLGGILARAALPALANMPQPTIHTTIIAGTAGPRGHWSPFGDQPNDRVVAVEETRLGSKTEVILVP